MSPKITSFKEWHFPTITDLRAWVLHNRDEIRAGKYEMKFTVLLAGEGPIPDFLEGATIDATLTPHIPENPGDCCCQGHVWTVDE